jgi:hypothetical protein
MLKLQEKADDGVFPYAAALCANPDRASANEQRFTAVENRYEE